jgi:photosystem II stability/assembly factor-like uncharacterized protein
MLLIAAGCEAPLKLEAVERTLEQPLRRSDRYQAAADNGATIVAVGNQGLILRSADRGRTWARQELPGWPSFIDVTACGDGGFAALATEGQVWTSDGKGKSWSSHSLDNEEAPQAITCDPGDRLWVVGSFSSIFSSEDDGESWLQNSLDEDVILTNVQFIDEVTGFITGEFGTVLTTSDGGRQWEPLPPLPDDFYPLGMFFRNAQTGWVTGLGGQILHTADGGNSWQEQSTATLAPLYGIEPAGPGLFAVGGEGMILELHGKQWQRLDYGERVRVYLRATLAIGDETLLTAGNDGTLLMVPTAAR